MKTLSIVIISLFCYTIAFNQDIQRTHYSDKEKILETMKLETNAFYNRDYKGWKSQWSQENDCIIAWNNRDGSYVFMRGWEEINDYISTYIKSHPDIGHPNYSISNMKMRIYDGYAIVTYDEYVANDKLMFSKVPETKSFIKEDGKWKLHKVISFWDYDYKYSKTEVEQALNSEVNLIIPSLDLRTCGCFEKYDHQCKTLECEVARHNNIAACLEKCPQWNNQRTIDPDKF